MARRRADSLWPPPAAPPAACALCGRSVPTLTEHHLIPRSQGRRRGVRAHELPTVQLCAACHKFLHATFSNAELAQDHTTVQALLTHDDVRRFVAWIRRQPVSKGVRVR